MNYIFYQSKTKFTNTGDVLINRALIEALREFGSLRVNCGKDIPDSFIESLGVQRSERVESDGEFGFIVAVIKCAIKSLFGGDRVYIFSGPGDMYGGNFRLIYRNFVSSIIFCIFRLFRAKIIRIGRSVGPISSMMVMSERIRTFFLSDYYVRDTQSLSRCKQTGIRKVKMCPDMSWLYHETHDMFVNHTNAVMINLRNSIFDSIDEKFIEATLMKCEEILKILNERMNGRMKVYVAYQVGGDAAFSRTVYEFLNKKFDVEYDDQQIGLTDMEQRYRMVDFHISNRMHSLLVGYKYGALPIALIDTKHHVKISATFQDCNLEHLMVDVYNTDIKEKVDNLFTQREKMLEFLWLCEKNRRGEIKETLHNIFC